MVFRVFLTGGDAGRRTSLLIRALSDLRVISGGWVKLTLSGGAERVPGLVEPREAAAAELPLPVFEDSRYSPEALLSRAAAALDEGAAREMCWLDPLLGDELADGAIAARIEELLGLELPVIGSVAAREECPNPELYDRILSRLGADEGTLLLDADALDDGALVARLREWDVNILDWAHHRKFDPQMKLRARRRKSIFPE